jgi:hypothetical protein
VRRSVEHFPHQDQLPQASRRTQRDKQFIGDGRRLRRTVLGSGQRHLVDEIVGEGRSDMPGHITITAVPCRDATDFRLTKGLS